MSRYTTDKRWKRLRARKLAADPTCEDCRETAANQVDHVDGLGLDGPRAYDWGNLRALCQSCHSRKTARFGVARKGPRRRPLERHPGLID